jgi:hypothetical protein
MRILGPLLRTYAGFVRTCPKESSRCSHAPRRKLARLWFAWRRPVNPCSGWSRRWTSSPCPKVSPQRRYPVHRARRAIKLSRGQPHPKNVPAGLWLPAPIQRGLRLSPPHESLRLATTRPNPFTELHWHGAVLFAVDFAAQGRTSECPRSEVLCERDKGIKHLPAPHGA